MVPNIPRISYIRSFKIGSRKKITVLSNFQKVSSVDNPRVNGSSLMRSAFETKGLDAEIIDVLLESCTASTRKQYSCALNKWLKFCSEHNLSPYTAHVNVILRFLNRLYMDGASYSSLNTMRSALSLVLPSVDSFQVGAHPLVVRYLKAVGKLRPPVPRYKSVWDVSLLLNLFRSWPSNENLSLKQLSHKTVALLAILSGQRVQTLSLIELEQVVVNGSVMNILIPHAVKTSKPGVTQPSIVLAKYSLDTNLCPVEAVTCYINLTREIRKGKSLFVSYEYPYKNVGSQTISRWLKTVLKDAGIDTTIFTSHSYRHASTSKAFACGVGIDIIFDSAGWMHESKVFGKYYNCKINSRCDYSDTLLKG
ncbi:unnamed protein product [Orchesella dallaii]|uniref:Tyr recombinase domain-containing protein n=1 Tax=Orchesella dallaii TaxID=48710 RepID=A0ABP1QUU5_9HEXA